MLSDSDFELLARHRPPAGALDWAARAVDRGGRVVSTRRLRGGSSSAVHALDIDDRRGRRHRLVLRRFIRPDWQEPELARAEANVLQLLEGSGVPAPRLVALDAEAASCDVPALLMALLPGRAEPRPRDMREWLWKLAGPLPMIHGVRGNAGVQEYRPYTEPADFSIPPWAKGNAWRKVLDLAQGPAPEAPRRFIHRDYHAMNVLWSRGKVSGVVDWVNASMGPPEVDVAHCRINLAALSGVGIADQFLEAYSAVAGEDLSAWHPYRDAVAVLDSGLARQPRIFAGWIGLGLTARVLASRIDAFVIAIADRV